MLFDGVDKIEDGKQVAVNLETGEITQDGKLLGKGKPFSSVQLDIYKAGSLFEYAKDQ